MLIVSMSIAMLSLQSAAVPPSAESGKPVCKTEQKVGSRVRKRVCRTEAEWAAIEKASSNPFNNGEAIKLNDSRGYQ